MSPRLRLRSVLGRGRRRTSTSAALPLATMVLPGRLRRHLPGLGSGFGRQACCSPALAASALSARPGHPADRPPRPARSLTVMELVPVKRTSGFQACPVAATEHM
jgi:hypothetical protein